MVSYTLLLTGTSGVQEISATGSSYAPGSDLVSGAYAWTVRAYDVAGNVSAPVSPTASFEIVGSGSGTKVYLPLLLRNR